MIAEHVALGLKGHHNDVVDRPERPHQQDGAEYRATPYAIFIFQEYGRSIPLKLDESARIDGASPMHIYFRIYLPLTAPALVAVGTYALLLAWNEYLYQFLLLSNKQSMTVPVALAQFLNSELAPWNYMMAAAIIYALPSIATYYAFRNRMSSGLTMGGVKG